MDRLREKITYCHPQSFVIPVKTGILDPRFRGDDRKGDPVSRLGWKQFRFMLFMIIALAAPSRSFGAGLEVGPGDIYIENVSLGKPVAVSALSRERMKLNIKNKGASACTYSIGILRSAQTTATLKQGYIDIPDISWIFPESKEIQIPGNSSKDVELYIKIPENKEYYNKKYQAVIEVKSKKNSPQELFVLACQLKIFFSTLNSPPLVGEVRGGDNGRKNADK